MYGYQVVAFGDRPAALALELAKEMAARIRRDLDALAAEQLLRHSYMDDKGGGGSHEDVRRM